MTSQYRHRRSSTASTVFPTLEPGEIAVNTANRQIAVGDAAGGTTGAPKNLLALRFFDTTSQYAIGDLAYQNQIVYRAKVAISPGAFNPTQWDMLSGAVDPLYVEVAGDTMTGALNLPAANPTAGTHATHKTYVDTLVSSKSSIYASVSPPAGVADNSIWMETDTGTAYFRYNDGDSTQWMILSPQIDVSLFVVKTGDTMSGPLNVVSPPTAPTHAASKAYVDTRATVIASDTPPPAPIDNTLWFETDTGLFFIRFNDGTSAQWCAIAAQSGDAVRYDTAQTLTGAQQTQARQNIYAAPFDAMAYSGMQINGSMEVSQESLALTTTVTNTLGYVVDGFGIAMIGTGATIATGQASIVTLPGFQNCLIISCTVANPMSGSLDMAIAYQFIEGYRWSRLLFGNSSAQPVTIGFWVFPNITGTMAVSIRGSDRSYAADVAVTAGLWQYKTVTVPGCVDGTWPTLYNTSATLSFCFGAGSGRKIAANTWTATANGTATAATTNFFAATGVCYLTGVIVLPGVEAPSAARSMTTMRSFEQELAACQRYYFKTFDYAVQPKQNNGYAGSLRVATNATSTFGGSISYPVVMRTTPTVITYSPVTNSANWYDQNNGAERTGTVAFVGVQGVAINGVAGVVHGLNHIHITANARL